MSSLSSFLRLSALGFTLAMTPLHAAIAKEAPAKATIAPAADIESVKQALVTWLDTVKNKQPADITALYAEDGILLSTLKNKPFTTQAERLEYFKNFKTNKGLRGEIIEQHPKLLGNGFAMNNGTYIFRFEKDGNTVEVPARFTYVYRMDNGVWKIIAHHSSKMPETGEDMLRESK